jgi:hypothetical protein
MSASNFSKRCVENAEKEHLQQLQQQSEERKEATKSRANLPPKSWSRWAFVMWFRILAALDASRGSGILPDVLRDSRKNRELD